MEAKNLQNRIISYPIKLFLFEKSKKSYQWKKCWIMLIVWKTARSRKYMASVIYLLGWGAVLLRLDVLY